MKHIKNAIVFTAMFIYQLFVTLVGIITIPFYMFSTEDFICTHAESLPNKKFSNSWYDSLFGNSEDGLLGDVYYKAKTTPSWWTTYNWCAWRNPIHNLALRMGVNEVIVNYVWIGNRYTEDRVGHEGAVYSEATGESGKVYAMYRWCKLSKWFEYSANVFSFVSCVIMYPINLIINFILAVYHLIIYRICGILLLDTHIYIMFGLK